MQDAMIKRAKELLADGTVQRVVGWKKGDFSYDITPALFESAEELDADFVYDDFCGANLSKYLIEQAKKEGKTLVFQKPCDSYSFAQLLKEHRIDREKVYNYASYVAVNISSPNTPNLRTLQLGDALVELVQALKKKQHELAVANNRYVPIAIKIAPDLSDEEIENICRIFLENDVDGIIATNTTLDREMIANMPHVTEAGGLSGKPEFRKSTDVLAKINKIINGRIPIIGVGGVDSPMAAAEKIKNGASLIQIYSGFIYKGPELIKNIVNYL